VQRHAAHAERVGQALLGAGAVTIGGNAEAVDPESGHVNLPFPGVDLILAESAWSEQGLRGIENNTMANRISSPPSAWCCRAAQGAARHGAPFAMVRIVGRRAVVSGHGPLNADGSRPAARQGGQRPDARAGLRGGAAHGPCVLGSLQRAPGDLDRITAWTRVFGR
jgi:hypothetical protein